MWISRKLLIYVMLLTAISLQFQASVNAQAQDKESLRFANRIEPLAAEYFRIGDYKRALEGYLVLDSIIPNNTEYNYRIGLCYLNTNFKSKAYPYLEFVYLQDDAPENIFFELGRAYHYGHEFEKAMIFYESYKKQIKFNPEYEDTETDIQQIDRYIQMCRNGQRLVRNPLIRTRVVNLGENINSEYTDFSPLINRDEDLIIFSSKRQATPKTKSDPLTNEFYESVFYSNKNSDQWEEARYIGTPIHHDDLHDAPVGLSPDGTKLFLYRGDDNSFSARIAGHLYVSNYNNGEWSEPAFIEEINTEGWESHASITADNNTLVFTSDREGGMGGTDIYISRRKLNGAWSEPENIGGYINSKFDEDGPFIHPDGNKLYFSSKGHVSMGGYDIFYTEYLEDKGRWTRPENVGYPINTADDDVFFVWSADGERAYFSSEREDSYGGADIYMLIRDDTDATTVNLHGEVIDKYADEPTRAEIIVRDMLSNNLIGIFDTEENGEFSFDLRSGRQYFVVLRAEGFRDEVTELDLREIQEEDLERNFEIRKRR